MKDLDGPFSTQRCVLRPCEHEDECKALGKVASALGKRNHALANEVERLQGKLEESRRALADANHRAMDAYRELLALRTQLEGVPPSTDRPDLRAKFLGAFENVIGPCTAHDAFSTACLEDGDQYLP